MDTVLQLKSSPIPHRTNPASTISRRPGGVAANIARYLSLLGSDVWLYAPRPTDTEATDGFDELGVEHIELIGQPCDCSYTAVLAPDGDLELGLAAMDDYDELGEHSLPANFPNDDEIGTLVIDAAFKSEMIQAAAAKAHSSGCQVMGAGTSPAKVGKLRNVAWDVLALNEAEAAVFAGQKGQPDELAARIAKQTGGAVAVTCGGLGAFLAFKGEVYCQFAPPTLVKNANGAGDAFSATLFSCLSWERSPEVTVCDPDIALRLAVSAGSYHAEKGMINPEEYDYGLLDSSNSYIYSLREKYIAAGQCESVGNYDWKRKEIPSS